MSMRSCAFALVTLLAACQTTNPVVVTPSFTTTPALATRNPTDIAVLAVEDGTPDHGVGRLCELMRATLSRQLISRLYTPLNAAAVDAGLSTMRPGPGESTLSPAYLKRISGHANKEDAVLAVRVSTWDESLLLVDNRVRFQLEAALAGADGELLWHGTMQGAIKAGGSGASPRDKEAMARSCAELAMTELLNHLQPRRP